MNINDSLKESFPYSNKRYFYPIEWLLQNKDVVVPSYYEKELEECKLLHKTVLGATETPAGKGERQKRGPNEESSDRCSDIKSLELAEAGVLTSNDHFLGTRASDAKDQRVERKPKEAGQSTLSRFRNEKSRHRGPSGRTETLHSGNSTPPGFEKVVLKTEEKLDKSTEKGHFVVHLSEKATKESLFQSTFLEKGGRFAKGPDEHLTFQRPQSILLKEWNQTEVPECLSFLVDLSRTCYIQSQVRNIVEDLLTMVETNLICADSRNEKNSISEIPTPEMESTVHNVPIETIIEPLISNSSEVTVEDEDIEKIVLKPGFLMNVSYDNSMNASSSMKQSRVTKWTEELDEPAGPVSQESVIHTNATQEAPLELEKNIDSFLASVRKRTLSKKSNMHPHSPGTVHNDGTEAQSVASSPGALWSNKSPFMEENLIARNEWKNESVDVASYKYSFSQSPEKKRNVHESWKRTTTPNIALIDPAICDAKIKTTDTCMRFHSSSSSLDSKYHSPTWSQPITKNGFHQPTDSSLLLKSILGSGNGQSNSVFHRQRDPHLEQPVKMYSSSLVRSPQALHRKKAVYAEDLEQALIARTVNSSKQDADASRTDSSISLLQDSRRHSGKPFM